MPSYPDISTPRSDQAARYPAAVRLSDLRRAMARKTKLRHGSSGRQSLLHFKQLGHVVGDRQQMQFRREPGPAPQAKPANPPIVLPAPEDSFDDLSPSIDCLGSIGLELVSNLAHLRVIRPNFDTAESARILCTGSAHR